MVTLRTFHLIFILAAIILADMFGAWAIHEYGLTGAARYLWMGIPAFVGGLGLCAYSIFFVRRMDRAGIH